MLRRWEDNIRTELNETDVNSIDSVQYRDYWNKTIILPVVLYGCEAWSLTLREECRLRVFENRILRRIFGPKS